MGATDWCTHPDDLDEHGVTRVRGTKNPDIETIVALRPDLVLANAEENKPEELDKLREAGLAVYVTDIRTVDGALRSLERMLAACGLERPAWIDGARAAWDTLPLPDGPRRAVVPIWRKPWMAVGSDTFTGAVLARLGIENVLGDSSERYPRFTRRTCRRTTSSCCPTSRTASPPTTAPRRSRPVRAGQRAAAHLVRAEPARGRPGAARRAGGRRDDGRRRDVIAGPQVWVTPPSTVIVVPVT